jgi:hypothetical protein
MKCLEFGERSAEYVTEADIQTSLDDFGMIIIGGGNPLNIAAALGYTGRERIIDLVDRGGAYIGLGAGAYIASNSVVYRGVSATESPIGLYQGVAKGPIDIIAALPSYTMALVELESDPLNPMGVNALMVLYYAGPDISITNPASAWSIGKFTIANIQAGYIFERGLGRVIVCSVNPEIEENSDIDGSDFGSELLDPDSDWQWLLTMVEWGFRERL